MSIVAHPLFTKLQTARDCGDRLLLSRLGLLLALLILPLIVGRAQVPGDAVPGDKPVQVVEGVVDSNVYGLRQSLRINGTVREGAIAFGGDVIVQGTVEGDVAAIGGSVIQLAGAKIGGDVFVLGGVYRHVDKTPDRKQQSMTVMYAGYEAELQEIMRNPSGLLTPRWSPTLIGLRLLWVKGRAFISTARTLHKPAAVGAAVTPADHGHHSHDHAHHGHDHGHHHHDHHGHDHHHHGVGQGHDHAHDHAHDHCHDHDDHASAWGHAHAPEPQELAGPGGWRRGLSAIVAVGMRPCSGAILVLVFALAQGLFWAGVVATFVMGLGTAITVAAIATIAVGAKAWAKRFADTRSGYGMLAMRGIEVCASLVIIAFGALLLAGYMASERLVGM